jgi:hypothetical protein
VFSKSSSCLGNKRQCFANFFDENAFKNVTSVPYVKIGNLNTRFFWFSF